MDEVKVKDADYSIHSNLDRRKFGCELFGHGIHTGYWVGHSNESWMEAFCNALLAMIEGTGGKDEGYSTNK